MATNCLFNLQKAVFTALTADSPLTATVTGIFTHIPQDTAFPYISISVVNTQDQSTIETNILEATLEVNSYGRTRGTEEVSGIMADVKNVLHHESLTVTGCVCLGIHMIEDAIEELGDGLTWHGTQRFKVWLQEV